jgi:hypothetical protein
MSPLRDTASDNGSAGTGYCLDWEEIHVNIFLKIRLIKEKTAKPLQGTKSLAGLLLNHGIPSRFPGFHTALNDFYVGVAISI